MFAATSDAPAVEHSQKHKGLSATFQFLTPNPALSVLRPAVIPQSVNLYEAANFECKPFSTPARSTLVDGLLTLNAIGTITDTQLNAIAASPFNQVSIWAYVDGGFSQFAEDCTLETGLNLSGVLQGAYPLQDMARHWLNWHDQAPSVIPEFVLDDMALMPEIGTGSAESEAFCLRLPDIFNRNQRRIAAHLNSLCRSPTHATANDFPLMFITDAGNSVDAPLSWTDGDMVGLCIDCQSSDFSQPVWNAVVQALNLIGECLRPMMTPAVAVDLSPVQMEEETEDVEAILTKLKELDKSPDDEDAVQSILQEIEPFIIDEFGFFQASLEAYHLGRATRKRWLADEESLSVHEFRSLIDCLPEPESDLDMAAQRWLSSVSAKLPESREDSALEQVGAIANVEGTLDMLLPVFFEDDQEFTELSIQPMYEVFMQDAEESCWHLGWDIPPSLLVKMAIGVRAGNELLADLSDLKPCS